MGLTEHCICLRWPLCALMECDGHRHHYLCGFHPIERSLLVFGMWLGGAFLVFGVVGRNQCGKSGTWDGFFIFGERLSYGRARISRARWDRG